MALNLDILGFGSKRKTAFRILDREWAALSVDPRPIDGGVRQLLFQWAGEYGDHGGEIDATLLDLAAFTGFLMLGPELAARPFGKDGLAAMEYRLESALLAASRDGDKEESLDVKVIKLILAAKLADRDIETLVTLDQGG